MELDLKGRRALVCGASQGIGRATAIELAALGAQVIVMARRSDVLDELVAELPGSGHGTMVQDISDRQSMSAALDGLTSSDPIHILIHNTGGPKGGPIAEATEEEFTAGFSNHVLSARLMAEKLLPGMKAAGYGRLINIISTSVKAPIPGLGVSNTIRAAMANWSKTLSSEVASFGVTVNCVLPGMTRTPRLASLFSSAAGKQGVSVAEIEKQKLAGIPAGRFGEANEIASLAAFLASPAASYINGTAIPVDGGRTPNL